jgi:molecular chaperone GrpE
MVFANISASNKNNEVMEEKDINIADEKKLNKEEETAEETQAAEETAEEATAESEDTEKDPLEEANAQIEELKDKYLRTVAEFDNYRKRTLKEKTELILNGGEKTITAILPVLDDMERAIANGDKTEDPQVLKEGMELIFQKFLKTLEGLGVHKIDTEDADFNTDMHEAIAMVPAPDDNKKGKVLDCVQTGYQLNEKVIRHAKVAVGQ